MPDLLQLVAELAAVFDHLRLQFALGGALATSYWAIARATQDIDCLVAIPAISYQSLADELQALGCQQFDETGTLVGVDAVRMRNQSNERHLIECVRGGIRIELFVPVVELQSEILRRAIQIPLGDRNVPITTAEDLILLKLAFHRHKDLQDIRGILRIQRGKLDVDYLRLWSGKSLEPAVQSELEDLIAESSSSDGTTSTN
jgi:hypothetical protein